MTVLRDYVNITDDMFVSRIPAVDRVGDDPDNWYWDSARDAAQEYADNNAHQKVLLSNGKHYVQAPPAIRVPGGIRYKFRTPFAPHHHDGGGLIGDSSGSPIVQYECQSFLDYHRTRSFHVGGIHFVGPFTHGSHLVMFREQSTDAVQVSNTLENTFEDIRADRLHMVGYWWGNQMTDGVQFRHMRTVDVFRPMNFVNSQGVNVAWEHGEWIWGEKEDLAYYAAFFDSFPYSNAGGADIYDSAAIYAQRGGQVAMRDVSLIGAGSHILFANPAAADSTGDTVKVNTLSYSMYNCRGEMRWPESPKHGVVRSLVPHPSGPPAIVPKVYIDPATQFNCQYGGPVNLFNLSNGMEIINHARVNGKSNARVKEYVNALTGTYPGKYDSQLGSGLPSATDTSTALGAVGAEDKHHYNRGSMGWR